VIILTLPAKAVVVTGVAPHSVQTLGRSGQQTSFEARKIGRYQSVTHGYGCRKESVRIPSSRTVREYLTGVFQQGRGYWQGESVIGISQRSELVR
jgi:hypothetical protein